MFLLLLYILLVAVPPCWSTVSVQYPIAEQFPLIARVDIFFSWSFSLNTFQSSDGDLNYAASNLPGWLSFDPYSLTLYGTPSIGDVGNPAIMITASDSESSESSYFILCVTSYPPPVLNRPLSAQFIPNNPSLSSVFVLSPGSALQTYNPALRIPPDWSFSIGFQGDTFTAINDLYYVVLQADGMPLPGWLQFNPETFTLDGVVPGEYNLSSPQILSLSLHASDQEGYTAVSTPFDLVLAEHEFYVATPSLPTLNVTASTSFNWSLWSPADFSGVFLDAKPIRPEDISSLSIDTSPLGGWLKYDGETRTLSGTPPSSLSIPSPLLPVTLTATCNQTIHTNVSLAMVPSYFSSPTLPAIGSGTGNIAFNLAEYFSNATSESTVNLTAAFSPNEASNYLTFDPGTAKLTGTLPTNLSTNANSHIVVTFTAYSYITHSTSHASLSIARSMPDNAGNGGEHSHINGLSAAAHARLVLGLEIAFGLVGGLALLGAILAAFRRCARVEDTALGGEEGRSAWTDNDRKWYGMRSRIGEAANKNRSNGWLEKADVTGRPAIEILSPRRENYGTSDLGIQRVLTRKTADPQSPNSGSQVRSPGAVMRKAEFFGKIRETVRHVSDKYTRGHRRPVIGKPVLVTQTDGILGFQDEVLPFENGQTVRPPSAHSYEDRSYADSTANTLTDSPTSSTGDRSIPRRRADFAPPRSPKDQDLPRRAHPDGPQRVRKRSTDSVDSLGSNTSAKTHAAEAVVQTATRIPSVKGRSGVPQQPTVLDGHPLAAGARPRLVPFTSATRVPVPRVTSSSSGGDESRLEMANKRIASQTAKVIENGDCLDDLSIGIHYVRSLGGDGQRNSAIFRTNASTRTVSTNVRSSFSSLESSRHSHGQKYAGIKRLLVRVGEKFKFRLTLEGDFTGRALDASLISGRPLPGFIKVDFKGASNPKGVAVFHGIPAVDDIGEANIGVYTSDDGECVGRVIVEIVGRGA